MKAINTSRDTLACSNLRTFLYKCDTMNLLKQLCDVQLTLDALYTGCLKKLLQSRNQQYIVVSPFGFFSGV